MSQTTTPSIRIIKIASCPTCSIKATLTYHIGCKAHKQLYMRISNNTGGGFFSAEWVAYSEIQAVLANHPADKPITATALNQLFKGKSVNTPAFLLAVLANEGLVKLAGNKQRGYIISSSNSFDAEITKLTTSNIDLQVAPTTTAPSLSQRKQSKQDIATA